MQNIMISDNNKDINKDLLRSYYKRFFPHRLIFRWLSYYGRPEDCIFMKREFACPMGIAYARNQSYECREQFEKYICEKSPTVINIGAVMEEQPRFNVNFSKIYPKQRELTFDIDMNEYDDVRTCCKSETICEKCWKFIIVAVRILEAVLRDDFGFRHIFWVFSGRRGIHGWVCDYEARHLKEINRIAISEYLQLLNSDGKVNLIQPIHHSIKRALKIIQSMFEEVILEDQNLFATADGINKLIKCLPEDSSRESLRDKLKNYEGETSKSIWSNFVQHIRLTQPDSFCIEEIQLSTMYPRLDNQVTRQISHLLKSPFCIHPATGKCCVPLSAEDVYQFNPVTCPTIWQFFRELHKYDNENSNKEVSIKDYKKTSFVKFTDKFQKILCSFEKNSRESYKASFIDLQF